MSEQPFDVAAYVAQTPPPSRRQISEALWVAAGRVPVPHATITKIQHMVAHFQQAHVAASTAVVAESSDATVEQVVAVVAGTAISTGDEHPEAGQCYTLEQAAWEDRFARELLAPRLVASYCVNVELVRQLAHRLCGGRPTPAVDWTTWARQVQGLNELLENAWDAGFTEGRDEL